MGRVRLGLQRLFEDFAGHDVANLDGQLLQVVEGGAPGRPFRAPQLVDSVFRCPLQGQTYLIDQ